MNNIIKTKSLFQAFLLMTQGKANLTARQVAFLPMMESNGLIKSEQSGENGKYTFKATAKLKQLAA